MARFSAALKAELTSGHPDTGPYDANDATAATEINTVNRTRQRVTMSAGEIMEAIDNAEFAALSVAHQARVDRVLGLGAEIIIGPGNGHNAVQELLVFGGGSATITALASARNVAISRADEIGLPVIRAYDVTFARAM